MINLEPTLYDKIYWITEKRECSYCHVITYDHKSMMIHEDRCDYNPENKNCLTCDTHCKIQPGGGYSCRAWKNVKFERTKKLLLLKNKIKMHGVY
jgi:hypothetical protein